MHFRFLFLAFMVLGTFACARKTTTAEQSGYSAAGQTGLDQHLNREEKNAAGTENILIGPSDRVAYESEPYSKWFHPAYQRYTPNAKIMEELQPMLENVSIRAYTGSWCMDSQRDLPRFYKVIDQAHFPHARFSVVNLREDKTSPNGEEKSANITAVPTFILYRDGKEVGRIVESAYPTIEMNMLTILKGEASK
ncbi:thioredoxin family protein [Rufibacter sediminis]|uniref:Thioredoxin family protein n=1 Tax=Rufibacter sediminis TaxID=2762756 RepID=A0ABR6VMR2_9BACT|nr:thioredoxin family protein [Rufibacter sediminis]MBC3538388.1 thioredoxin family protein [Rufibacter sediminis]